VLDKSYNKNRIRYKSNGRTQNTNTNTNSNNIDSINHNKSNDFNPKSNDIDRIDHNNSNEFNPTSNHLDHSIFKASIKSKHNNYREIYNSDSQTVSSVDSITECSKVNDISTSDLVTTSNKSPDKKAHLDKKVYPSNKPRPTKGQVLEYIMRTPDEVTNKIKLIRKDFENLQREHGRTDNYDIYQHIELIDNYRLLINLVKHYPQNFTGKGANDKSNASIFAIYKHVRGKVNRENIFEFKSDVLRVFKDMIREAHTFILKIDGYNT
jgi:hypothetical protein